MSKKSEYGQKFTRYIRRTAKNKIIAMLLIACGVLSRIGTEDATVLVVTLIFAIPLFFARKNYIF